MLKKKKVDNPFLEYLSQNTEDEEETPMAIYKPEPSITVTEITEEDLSMAPVVLNFDPEKPLEFADSLVKVLDDSVVEESAYDQGVDQLEDMGEVGRDYVARNMAPKRTISEELHQAILRYQSHLNRGARLEAAFYESQIHEKLKKYDVH